MELEAYESLKAYSIIYRYYTHEWGVGKTYMNIQLEQAGIWYSTFAD